MAFDLIHRKTTGRDWSLGMSATMGLSLAHHPEMHARDKVLALAKLVGVEIKNNGSITSIRARGGSITRDDRARWKKFNLAWGSWYERNISSGQPVSNATIADLERWRSENAEWTKRLTTPIPLPTTSSGESLTRPSETPPGEKKSKTPWVIGLIGATFLALGFGRR